MFGNLPKIYSFVPLWDFNMAVNEEILKCGMSWKRLIVEQNRQNLGLAVLCAEYVWWFHSLGSFLGHFAKYLMLRFSKGYCSHIFKAIWTKIYCKYVAHKGI